MKYFGLIALLSIVLLDLRRLQALGVTTSGFVVGGVGILISLIGVDFILYYNDLKAGRPGATLSLPARITLSIASLIDSRLQFPHDRAIGYFGVGFVYFGLLLSVCGCIFL
jgi:hypothetical protein